MLTTPNFLRPLKWTWSGAPFEREKKGETRFENQKPTLRYKRARYYSAQLGRFISRDPIGFADGHNLYRAYFVPGTMDPTGLGKCEDEKQTCVKGCSGIVKTGNLDTLRWCFSDCDEKYAKCLNIEADPEGPITPLPSDSPKCDDYACDDTYFGTNAGCFCKCAGDSEWAQYVRGCLRKLYDLNVGPDEAHARCYKAADDIGFPGGRPMSQLAYCFVKCTAALNGPIEYPWRPVFVPTL